MKAVFGLSQYLKNNTPKIAQLIGDISLIASFITSLPILLNQLGVVEIPVAVEKAVTYATITLAVIKFATKFFGIKTESDAK